MLVTVNPALRRGGLAYVLRPSRSAGVFYSEEQLGQRGRGGRDPPVAAALVHVAGHSSVALLIGMLIGPVNGFIIVRLQVNAFIATLGMATIVGAVETIVSRNSQPQPPTSSAWANLTQYQIFGFQVIFFYVIIIALIRWWFLERTPPAGTCT